MVRLFFLCLFAPVAWAALPPELAAICRDFRTENPQGWSFTQTTTAEGRTLVERFDARQPEFNHWTLLQSDGHPPSEQEAREYKEKFTRRSRGGTAPNIASQLDLATAELVSEDAERCAYRFRLKSEDSDDKTAAYLRVTVTFFKPARCIERFELANVEAFSPVFGVKIAELRTSISYSLPAAGRPALLEKVATRTRGRAFFKSLDAEMLVTYGDYAWAGKAPPPAPATATPAPNS